MSDLNITDSTGRVRPAIHVKCDWCKDEFVTYKYPSMRAKFCSTVCVYKSRIKLIDVECAQCHCVFKKQPSDLKQSKSGFRFCSKRCKGKAQRIGGIKEIMPSHYGTSTDNYRGLFEPHELICFRCGYKEFPCAVEIHHKDKDRTNNKKENLIPLCACCHAALHNNLWSLGG